MERKFFHAKFTTVKAANEPDGSLYIEGWASTASKDRDEEIISPEAFKSGIAAFMKNPILLYMHNPTMPIGKVIEMKVDEVAGFWVKAYISKAQDVENVATKIKEGILRAFSIGFSLLDADKIEDGIRMITGIELWEVSVVAIPSNRDAMFNVAKAAKYGSDLMIHEASNEYVSKADFEAAMKSVLDTLATVKAAKENEPEPPEAPNQESAQEPVEAYKHFTEALNDIERMVQEEKSAEAIRRLAAMANRSKG